MPDVTGGDIKCLSLITIRNGAGVIQLSLCPDVLRIIVRGSTLQSMSYYMDVSSHYCYDYSL